jgi:hypothetical protein
MPDATTTIPGATTTLSHPWNLTCERKWGELAREQCYMESAAGQLDPSICENMTFKSLRETCFYGIAIEKKDLNLCNKVEDDIKRRKCFDVVQQNENTT